MTASSHDSANRTTDPLVDARANGSVPEAPVKRITAAVLAGIMLLTLVLPWWSTIYEFEEAVGGPLVGWQMLQVGFGAGPADQSGFTVLGNALLGLLPLLPLLALAGMLIARAVKPRSMTAPTIVVWAVLELLAIAWLLVFGGMQVDKYLGEHPVMFGALVAAMASLFAAIAFGNWWRRGERDHFEPSRFGRRSAAGDLPEPDEVEDADELTAEELFGPDADAAQPDTHETDSAADVRRNDSSS